MLVLERMVGEELVFSNGLRLRLEEIGLDHARLALSSDEGRAVVSCPFEKLLPLAAGIAVRIHRRNSQRVRVAIDAPREVGVLRAELLEISSARRSRLAVGHVASGRCSAG
jgi:sRNA-binding carbon storage regulator CsrA